MEPLRFGIALNAEKTGAQIFARLFRVKSTSHIPCSLGFKEPKHYQVRTPKGLRRSHLNPIKDAVKGTTNQNNNLSNVWSVQAFAAGSSEDEKRISAEQTKAATSGQILGDHMRPSESKEATTGSKNVKRGVAVFTPEKARILRQKLRLLETWHDTMYHSAIASRLAMQNN